MNPWREDEGDSGDGPRKPGNWGCAIAAIVGSIAVIVAIVIALGVANGVAGSFVKDLR